VSVQAFDDLADAYDSTFTDTAVGRVLRDGVWARLARTYSAGERVLELGCGTGEDALWLAMRGVRVLATDASPRMVDIARSKAARHGYADGIEFRCLEMEQLQQLPPTEAFDGVFSDFGSVNCARNLAHLIEDVAARVRPGGRLVWVMRGRRRAVAEAGRSWQALSLQQPTPEEAVTLLRRHFSVTRVGPLGLLLPSIHSQRSFDRSPRVLKALELAERLAQQLRAFPGAAEHFIIEATRRRS
jgi:ubiquinone/menaquinone biosynthesis C-methylase UbiE